MRCRQLPCCGNRCCPPVHPTRPGRPSVRPIHPITPAGRDPTLPRRVRPAVWRGRRRQRAPAGVLCRHAGGAALPQGRRGALLCAACSACSARRRTAPASPVPSFRVTALALCSRHPTSPSAMLSQCCSATLLCHTTPPMHPILAPQASLAASPENLASATSRVVCTVQVCGVVLEINALVSTQGTAVLHELRTLLNAAAEQQAQVRTGAGWDGVAVGGGQPLRQQSRWGSAGPAGAAHDAGGSSGLRLWRGPRPPRGYAAPCTSIPRRPAARLPPPLRRTQRPRPRLLRAPPPHAVPA